MCEKYIKVYIFSDNALGHFWHICDTPQSLKQLVNEGTEVVSITPEIDVIYNKDGSETGMPLNCVLIDARGISHDLYGTVVCCRHDEDGKYISIRRNDISVIENHLKQVNYGESDNYVYDLLLDLRCEYPNLRFELEMGYDYQVGDTIKDVHGVGLVIYGDNDRGEYFVSLSKYYARQDKYLLSDIIFDYESSIKPIPLGIGVLNFRFKAFPDNMLFEVTNGVSCLSALSEYLNSDLVVVPLNRGRFWVSSFDGDVVSLLAWHQEFCGYLNKYVNMYICKRGTSVLHLFNETRKFYRSVYCKGTVIEITSDIDIPYICIPAGSRFEVDYIDDALNIQGHWLPPERGSLALYLMSDRFRIVYD